MLIPSKVICLIDQWSGLSLQPVFSVLLFPLVFQIIACMVQCSFILNSIKNKSAYWHFNLTLFDNKDFLLEDLNCRLLLDKGLLPLSCRRAVLTLLPKKGHLMEIKN